MLPRKLSIASLPAYLDQTRRVFLPRCFFLVCCCILELRYHGAGRIEIAQLSQTTSDCFLQGGLQLT